MDSGLKRKDAIPKDAIRRWVNGQPYLLHELVPELRKALAYFDGGLNATSKKP